MIASSLIKRIASSKFLTVSEVPKIRGTNNGRCEWSDLMATIFSAWMMRQKALAASYAMPVFDFRRLFPQALVFPYSISEVMQ